MTKKRGYRRKEQREIGEGGVLLQSMIGAGSGAQDNGPTCGIKGGIHRSRDAPINTAVRVYIDTCILHHVIRTSARNVL